MPDIRNQHRFLQLNGFTRAERIKCVALLRDAIVDNRGWILDFNQYSNLSICIGFEMPMASLPALAKSLLDAEVGLSSRTEQMLQGIEAGQPDESAQCTLQVLFIHDEPDLRRTVLAVPG